MSARACIVESCEDAYHGHGLCKVHYNRWWNTGHTEVLPPLEPPVCLCDDPQPDGLGECQTCFRPYKPRFMELRREWRECVRQRDLKIAASRAVMAHVRGEDTAFNQPRRGRDVRARSAPSPNHAAKDENDG